MSEEFVTEDFVRFFDYVVRGTKKGVIEWETTASPTVLTAPLGDEYSLKLELVDDLEGQTPEPDHVLSLMKKGETLIRLDRRDLGISAFPMLLASFRNMYAVFEDLWKRAFLKAKNISDELVRVNRLLGQKVDGEEDIPF